MRRWLLPGAGLLVAAALVFAVAAVFDNQPPELWVELDPRVPAGDTFELFVSANEPVTYELTYGELETEHVAQDLAVSLIGIPGVQELHIRAVDGSGNETTSQHAVEGVPAIAPVLNGPSTAQAGDPVTFTIEWEDTGLQIVDGSLALVNESGAHAPASIVPADSRRDTPRRFGRPVERPGPAYRRVRQALRPAGAASGKPLGRAGRGPQHRPQYARGSHR